MIRLGDAMEVLATLPAASVDSVVTDPPYELGFMGKDWDASGIANNVMLWRQVLRVLKPGGHLLAFGATRTYHRMTVAIEDAGFEIRDSLHWMYGTGFPKSLNVGDGRGTALKPAHEPIVLARKPLEGTVAANVAKHGTGALNIDGCRIDTPKNWPASKQYNPGHMAGGSKETATYQDQRNNPSATSGRFPANVLLDEAAAAELDAQSGVLKSGSRSARKDAARTEATASSADWGSNGAERMGFAASEGGASRFFYVAKPSKKERGEGNNHPTVKPVELMRYLVRLVTPPGGLVLDPFAGSGTTALAALTEGLRFLGIEREAAYVDIARARCGGSE